MIVEAKKLVCTNQDCRAEITVVRKPAVEKQNLRCACGNEFKKIYHPPALTVLGEVPGISASSPLKAKSELGPATSLPEVEPITTKSSRRNPERIRPKSIWFLMLTWIPMAHERRCNHDRPALLGTALRQQRVSNLPKCQRAREKPRSLLKP